MKKFRKAFVTDPTHDVTAIAPYVDDIVFLLDGTETYDEVSSKVYATLGGEFVPQIDVIIPMGRIVANLVIGIVISSLYNKSLNKICIGIYTDHDYKFIFV